MTEDKDQSVTIPIKRELLPLLLLAAGFVYTFLRFSILSAAAAQGGIGAPGPAAMGFMDVYNYLLWGVGLYLALSATQLMVSTDRFNAMKFSGFPREKARRLGRIYAGIFFAAKTAVVFLFAYVQVLSLRALAAGRLFELDRRAMAPALIVIIAVFAGGLYFLYREFVSRDQLDAEADRDGTGPEK